ncbi:uncharacterized protein CANTADRAFT_19886 [Suhomyces tanzawaensis NRRL Y-17324]|uniref:Aminopeptidase n=1 Tax=Suhomyces tanzawaensis NRRL Y-17324 TaxID=984487 RepID=A0A1E4SS44_9ASCO|nr:uncharacterized protein CANTADRAFT_19886 [Suhomyces tanzawaensis NRRL Y-17324]ODV82321.1 hypothetical protein CANTADRAFT_19886 [Suhomyces tanzawaensis NRRL Y-17324]
MAEYYETLPTALKPYHYDISISQIDVDDDSFFGKALIHFEVLEATDELHLNYRELYVNKVVISADKDIPVIGITEYKEKEYFVIKFDQPVRPGKLQALVEYQGKITSNMMGFYKSEYVENGQNRIMLSTQFEATDARRAFPCIDEPALKATFKLDITARSDWTVLANTPVARETAHGALKTVEFELTPVMSTYLVAWALGDFEYIESFTSTTKVGGKPIPVRVYTTKGYLESAQLALEIAPKILDYFSQVFEIDYPLPKLDLMVVHAYSHNAMENWGLITYRSTALLYDEKTSDSSYKQKVAYVIAHELAHQWFGNLVTMKWWDELWLNEGFATWVGYCAVDYLYPEWDIFSGFVSESLQKALSLDGLRNSHPIEVPVVDALDIDQVFDAISYLKGASTILMISNYLGTELFLKGVALYLKRNKFGNATSSDLWNCISEVSGKPVGQLMASWIKKVGFPIVNVDFDLSSQSLVLKQSRFLNSGDATEEENQTKWWIPLNINTDANIRDTVDCFESETLIIDNFPLANDFFKLNKESSGVFRVNYSPQILENNILPFLNIMSTKDRVGLIADSTAIAVAGGSTTSLLKLFQTIAETKELENDYVTWLELGQSLEQVASAFSGTNKEINAGLKKFKTAIYKPQALRFITEYKSGNVDKSDFNLCKLRSNILDHAATLAIPEVAEFALQKFNEWSEGKEVDPSLKSFIWTAVASSESFTKTQYEAILDQVMYPSTIDAREIALAALGHIQDDELSTAIMGGLLKPDIIPTMNANQLAVPLSSQLATRDKFWKFFTDNYAELFETLSPNMVVFERFVKDTLRNYQSMEKHDEIQNFFKGKVLSGFDRSLYQALDTVKTNAAWFARDEKVLAEYLQ